MHVLLGSADSSIDCAVSLNSAAVGVLGALGVSVSALAWHW